MPKTLQNRREGWVFSFVFGLIFLGAGFFFMWMMALKPMVLSIQSGSWPTLDCTVISSRVDARHDSDGSTYKALIDFDYDYNGSYYQSNTYNFNTSYSSGRSAKKAIVDKHIPGQNYRCWVNPDNPYQAVLDRSTPGIVWFVIPFTSIFVAIGGTFILGSFGIIGRAGRRSKNSGHTRVDISSKGYTTLVPGQSVKSKLLFTVIFSLIWNGITFFFARDVWQDYTNNKADTMTIVMASVFVLSGIATVFSILYQILALLNPKPILQISEGSPHLGQDVQLNLQFSGNTHKIKTLKVELEGMEKATYRVGTDVQTDYNIFHKKLLTNGSAVTHHPQVIWLSIPIDSMHSFKASNNEILWQIKVHADIPLWPDISYEYPIPIRPIKT